MVSGAEVIERGCGAGCGCRKYLTLMVVYLTKTVTGVENYLWLKVLSILVTPGCTVLKTDSFRR